MIPHAWENKQLTISRTSRIISRGRERILFLLRQNNVSHPWSYLPPCQAQGQYSLPGALMQEEREDGVTTWGGFQSRYPHCSMPSPWEPGWTTLQRDVLKNQWCPTVCLSGVGIQDGLIQTMGRRWTMEDRVGRDEWWQSNKVWGGWQVSVGPKSTSMAISNNILMDSASEGSLPLMPKQKRGSGNVSVKS